MRLPALLAFLTFFALSIAAPIAAQESTPIDITLYRDADSLTIFAPSAPYGLALQVTLPDNRTLTQSLVAYPAFRGAQPVAPACFRIERAGSNSPTPQDCQRIEIFIQTLTDGDVFWHDSTLNQAFTLMIVRDDQIYGICAAGISRCTATFIPAPQEVALCDGAADLENREVLVIVAKFDKLSDSPLNPDREWEDAIQNAIDQLKGQVNARVLVVPQIITTQDEALQLSDCYNATLVVWGKLAAARVESNYTAKARWSRISEQPGQTIFEADRTIAQSIIDQLTFFVSLDGGDTEYILNFVLGQLALHGENREEALPFLERAIDVAPAGREREMGVAAMYLYSGIIRLVFRDDIQTALAAFDKAKEMGIQPNSSVAVLIFFAEGTAQFGLGDYEQSIANFSQGIELCQGRGCHLAYFLRGLAYLNKGDNALAIADFDQVIDFQPDYIDAYRQKGKAHHILGDYALAVEDFTHSIELCIDNCHTDYLDRGDAYIAQGDYALAISDYTDAIELKSDYDLAYYHRGNAYAGQGDFTRAIEDYTRSIELCRWDCHFDYNDRGWAYHNLGDYESSIADFDQAISLQPGFADAYINRGHAYSIQGAYEQAILDYEQAIDLMPEFYNAYWGLGVSYDALERYDDALTNYHRYLELAGDDAAPSIITRVAELESATPTP